MTSDTAPSFFAAWTRTSSRMVRGMLEANRAAATAFGMGTGRQDDDGAGRSVEDSPAPGEDLADWSVDTDVDAGGEDLAVGDGVRFSKEISDADVRAFAAASGDTNPIHLDESFAADTRFGGRIAHGGLVAGLISAALARLPGEVIYLSQDLEFLRPVRIGDRATAEVEIAEALGDGHYRLSTVVYDSDDEPAVDGEAIVLID